MAKFQVTPLYFLFYIYILFFSSVQSCNRGLPSDASRRLHRSQYKNPDKLKLSPGSVIACLINIPWLKATGAEHAMFVTNTTYVAHVDPILQYDIEDTDAPLREANFLGIIARDGYKACRDATDEYNQEMMKYGGIEALDNEYAVVRARSDVGRVVYYNLVGCNCQHWITYWKYGRAYSVQTEEEADPDCVTIANVKPIVTGTNENTTQESGTPTNEVTDIKHSGLYIYCLCSLIIYKILWFIN